MYAQVSVVPDYPYLLTFEGLAYFCICFELNFSHNMDTRKVSLLSCRYTNKLFYHFAGIRASNVRGIIGVDDITLFPGSCPLKPEKAEINYGDCSFEYDTCGWRPVNPGNALDTRPQV